MMLRVILVCLAVVLPQQSLAQDSPDRSYFLPIRVDDGWEVSRAAALGFSEDSLTALLNLIAATPPQDFRALTVVRDGKLVLDAYFNTYNRNTLHDIRSAAKSITALLVGIAFHQQLFDSLGTPLYSLFLNGSAFIAQDPRRAQITIRDALTMRTGLDADAQDATSPGNEANWLDREESWLDYILRLPMTNAAPGEAYVYNSASAFLAGAAIEAVSGRSLRSYAEEHMFKPLGVSEFYWSIGPGGHTAAMGNLYLTNRTMAKIGQLLLDDGRWRGQVVLPSGWADELAQKRLELPNPFLDTHGYGYLWYVGTKSIADEPVDYVFASGNGGNTIYVVPRYRMVVAMCSSAYGTPYGSFRSNNIFESVLRAVIEDI